MSESVIRPDLVIPYKHTPAKARAEAAGMVSQTLPMAAMFMRNKLLSWSAVFLAIQSYLNEPAHKQEEKKDSANQPPLLRILFAIISLFTCYMDVFFPQPQKTAKFVKDAAETIAAATTAA